MREAIDKAKVLAGLARQHKLRETLDKLARQDLARLDHANAR